MKLKNLSKQKVAAVAVLILTALVAVFCLFDPAPSEPSAPAESTPAQSTPVSASPKPSKSSDLDPLELEDHGYFIDISVNEGALPNRQAPRRAYHKNTEEREYSKAALNEVVETILDSIITSDMGTVDQCNAIYYYVKGCISSDGVSVRSDWRKAAYWGFTTGKGDTFTYYACSRALLEGAGLQVKEVKREGGDLTEEHFWCLVNYNDGWYHFDPFPHRKSDPVFNCCLATDQQLANFDAGAGRDYYAFDEDGYPERAGGRAIPEYTVPMPRPEEYEDLDLPQAEPTKEPESSAVPSPSPEPTAEVTPSPSVSPSASPSATPEVTATPSSSPSASTEPEETPSVSPSPTPTESPSPKPTAAPIPSETPTPTPEPTPTPSPEPTPTPTVEPTPAQSPVSDEPLLPPGA